MKTLEEKIAVMQAAAAGKPIQIKQQPGTWDWRPINDPSWNWAKYDYQIAPEKLTIYIYKNKSTQVLFSSNGELSIPLYCDFVKKIEVEV